jgi:phosphoglycerate dehydrogenase-like enzyme
VGIVGASRIGRRVIELLRLLDHRLLLYDPLVGDAEAMALEVEKVDLDTLMARSDIVSLHAPLLPETRHMIDDPPTRPHEGRRDADQHGARRVGG